MEGEVEMRGDGNGGEERRKECEICPFLTYCTEHKSLAFLCCSQFSHIPLYRQMRRLSVGTQVLSSCCYGK